MAAMDTRRTLLKRLGAGLGLLGLAFLLDASAFDVLRQITLYDHWGEMREGLTGAKFLGSGLGTLVVGLAVWALDRRRWRRAVVIWMVAATAGLGAGVLKVATGRERPSSEDQVRGQERTVFHGPVRGARSAYSQSFPSGHTVGAFASATCLSAFYPGAAPVFYTVAAAAGANRVIKRQHFLSDVVAGALLSHLIALWLLSRRRVRRLWSADDEPRPLRCP